MCLHKRKFEVVAEVVDNEKNTRQQLYSCPECSSMFVKENINKFRRVTAFNISNYI